MSTYNGEQYLEEQLQSIINQKFRNICCSVELLVRDDGSKDGTVDILKKYKEKGLLTYYAGENIGWQKSFWNLLRYADDADYYAFSDQDDVWFEDKLSRAVERLSHEGDIPLLYGSDIISTDKDLYPLKENRVHKKIIPDFPHIIIDNFLTRGCTCVFNRRARLYMMEYDMEKYYVIGHDYLAGAIVSLFGNVIYDEEPSMFYRVHENNATAKDFSKIKRFIKRIWIFLSNWEHEISKCARSIETVYQDKIADNENVDCLYYVAHYREGIGNTINFLKNKAFRTGEFKQDFRLFIKILTRKI